MEGFDLNVCSFVNGFAKRSNKNYYRSTSLAGFPIGLVLMFGPESIDNFQCI
jgi:hypothetical protein